MDTRRFLLKTAALFFILLNNAALLSMKSHCNNKLVMAKKSGIRNELEHNKLAIDFDGFDNKPEANLPIEILEGIAAYAQDITKDIMKQTCKHFKFAISPTNNNFVSHPLFTTSEQNIQKMILYNSWHNNVPMVNALRGHVQDNMINISDFMECGNFGTGITCKDKKIAIDLPGALNERHNNSNQSYRSGALFEKKTEIDMAMYCAIVCNDTQAIKNLAPKIKDLYGPVHGYGRQEVQKALMMLLAKKGNKEAFEFMLINDPYRMREYHCRGQHFYEDTLLDRLNKSTDENMDPYKALCIQHGEKTSKEATPGACIIS